jgi:hypothetical protein
VFFECCYIRSHFVHELAIKIRFLIGGSDPIMDISHPISLFQSEEVTTKATIHILAFFDEIISHISDFCLKLTVQSRCGRDMNVNGFCFHPSSYQNHAQSHCNDLSRPGQWDRHMVKKTVLIDCGVFSSAHAFGARANLARSDYLQKQGKKRRTQSGIIVQYM